MIRTLALSAAVAAASIVPVVAHAAPQRSPAPVAADSEQLSGSPLLLILLIAVVVGGLIVLTADGDDPVSP